MSASEWTERADSESAETADPLGAAAGLLGGGARQLVDGPGEEAGGGVLPREQEGRALVGDAVVGAAGEEELVRQVHAEIHGDGGGRPVRSRGISGGGIVSFTACGVEDVVTGDAAAGEESAALGEESPDSAADEEDVERDRIGEVAHEIANEDMEQGHEGEVAEDGVPLRAHPLLVEGARESVVDDNIQSVGLESPLSQKVSCFRQILLYEEFRISLKDSLGGLERAEVEQGIDDFSLLPMIFTFRNDESLTENRLEHIIKGLVLWKTISVIQDQRKIF